MEDIDGGLRPAVDGRSLDEDEDEEAASLSCKFSVAARTAVWEDHSLRYTNMLPERSATISSMRVCPRNQSAQTVVCGATLRALPLT